MKRLKKIVGILLVMAMVMMASMSALASELGAGENDGGTPAWTEDPNELNDGRSGYEARYVEVTINTDGSIDLSNHLFVAYQIFEGTQETSGSGDYLGDVKWGKNVQDNKTEENDLLAALQKIALMKEGNVKEVDRYPFANCKTAQDVSEALEEFVVKDGKGNQVLNTQLNVQLFLDEVARTTTGFVKGNGKVLHKGTNSLPSGYYLIVDKTTLGADEVANAALLQPTVSIVINVKTSKPDIQKKVMDDKGNYGDTNNASMGDIVKFQISSNVPDMTHYNTYKFVVSDVLSEGLEFNANPEAEENKVVVSVGGSELNGVIYSYEEYKAYLAGREGKDVDPLGDSVDYILVYISADEYKQLDEKVQAMYGVPEGTFAEGTVYEKGTYLRIIFRDFYEDYLQSKNAEILINYTATVTKDAQPGTTGNPNHAYLQYWRNPDIRGTGDPDDDEFNPETPNVKGETPWKTTVTYTSALKLTKIDGEDISKKLAGAEFSVTGEKLNQVLVEGYVYVVEEDIPKDTPSGDIDSQSYYRLVDDTFTTTKPAENTMEQYADPETVYKKVHQVKKELISKEQVSFGVEVGGNGVLNLTGLAEGTYIITEVKAPYGYNLLSNPIKVVIEWNEPILGDKEVVNAKTPCIWTGQWGYCDDADEFTGKTQNLNYATDGTDFEGFAFEIENYTGALLPRTGGIGTTIFYVLGCTLVVVAGILLVLKRRAANNNED